MIIDTAAIVAYAGQNWWAFTLGAIITRPVICADLIFKFIMRVRPLKVILMANSGTINKWIDDFQAELYKNIEAEKAAEAAAPPVIIPPPLPKP